MPTIYFAAGSSIFCVSGKEETWSVSEMDVGQGNIQAVAADPSSGTVYAGTFDNGLFCTKDQGRTFEAVGENDLQPRVMALHVSPISGEGKYQRLYAGTEPSALYRSDDGGETWREFPALLDLPSKADWSFPPRPYTHHVKDIASGADDASFLIAGIELGGVMRSVDGGTTFEDRKQGSQFDVHNVVLHPADDRFIYEAGGGGYAWSEDKGKTWTTDNNGLANYTYLVHIAVDPGNKEVVLASGAEGPYSAYVPETAQTKVFRKQGNDPWQRVEKGLPAETGATVMHLLINPNEPGVFYGVNNRGIYRSADQGESWTKLAVPLPSNVEQSRIIDACLLGDQRGSV